MASALRRVARDPPPEEISRQPSTGGPGGVSRGLSIDVPLPPPPPPATAEVAEDPPPPPDTA
jgi:hypothetical protein